jgi:hypothetical protein
VKAGKRFAIDAPNWDAQIGGSGEDSWLADRDRKLAIADEVASSVMDTYKALERRNALYDCSPKSVREVPLAADWYISLAGFSLKTLGNIEAGPKAYGVSRSAKGLVQTLVNNPAAVSDNDLKAFSGWINSELSRVLPKDQRDPIQALNRVCLILGGRVIGRGQNMGGEEAVVIVKGLVIRALGERYGIETEGDGGAWAVASRAQGLEAIRIRIGGKLVVEFLGGGDRPDLSVILGANTIAVGEIKGRKDLSNQWESWMPQVSDHMQTWTGEFPVAARLFFGTLITADAVEGKSARGTKRSGFRDLHNRGLLDGIYNVAKVVQGDAGAIAEFDKLMRKLEALVK